MPSALLEAYVERMGAVAATRALEAADAAVYPHLTKKGAEDWWKRHAARANAGRSRRRRSASRRGAPQEHQERPALPPMFTLSLVDDGTVRADERPMSPAGLRSTLNQAVTLRGLPELARVDDA